MKHYGLHSVKQINRFIHQEDLWWKKEALKIGWNGLGRCPIDTRAKAGVKVVHRNKYRSDMKLRVPGRLQAKLTKQVYNLF